MLIETKFGNYELIKNERDAFDIVKFENKYLPEYFDKYQYIVGDLADDILRLKGFSSDPKSKVYFHYIPEYIQEGCAYNCKYYILKRVVDQKEEEIELVEAQVDESLNTKKHNFYKKKKFFKNHHNKRQGGTNS